MPPATLADWTTLRPFALPDLGPGIGPEQREALKTALQTIAADPTVQALVLFGSRATGSARPDSDVVAAFRTAQAVAAAGRSDRERQRRRRPPWAGAGGAAMTPQGNA